MLFDEEGDVLLFVVLRVSPEGVDTDDSQFFIASSEHLEELAVPLAEDIQVGDAVAHSGQQALQEHLELAKVVDERKHDVAVCLLGETLDCPRHVGKLFLDFTKWNAYLALGNVGTQLLGVFLAESVF